MLAGERIVRLERALSARNAELQNANERIRSGLRAAARVQQSMLPRQNIRTSHVHTAWKYLPADELCGDAIGLHLIDDRYLTAYVLDVSGHGVPAALLSVSAMHSMEPSAAQTSVLRDVAQPESVLGSVQRPARVAEELNRRFRASDNDGLYLTMFLGVLDTHMGKLYFTSAGHPPPIVLRRTTPIAVPDAGGLPLAITDASTYDDACVPLEPGDRICLVSDGVLEQFDPSRNEQFGSARLLEQLTKSRHDSPEQVTAVVEDALTAWAGTKSFTDDVSLVILDWLG
jgi:sigma-B regulation protein RsbU (phosphoserine phosphatase)